ncbi:MAG TPA: hypothetical protein DEQ14_02835 [Treponema sp.]|nr:hypothetical protein [Treponema sp.]
MRDDIVFQGQFIWSRRKEKLNIKKHKVSFETACRIFNDLGLYEIYDEANSVNEDRYNIIGNVDGCLLLFVTITDRDGLIRIISARKTDTSEWSEYYENIKKLQGN